MILALVALGFSLASMATLHQSWRTQTPRLLYSSMAGFLLSCLAWSYSQGWEFGLVYAFCLPGLLVWPFIGLSQVTLPPPQNRPPARSLNLTVKLAAVHTGHAVVVLVGLMLTSLLAALAISLRLPFEQTGQLAMCILLLPVVWGGLVYHYLAVRAKGKAVAGYVVTSVICVLMLMYLPGLE